MAYQWCHSSVKTYRPYEILEFVITVRKRSLRKGQCFYTCLSVILFMGAVCLSACWHTPPPGIHPLGRHLPRADTPPLGRHLPRADTPLPSACWDTHTPHLSSAWWDRHGYCWGWYASYWNAFLFYDLFWWRYLWMIIEFLLCKKIFWVLSYQIEICLMLHPAVMFRQSTYICHKWICKTKFHMSRYFILWIIIRKLYCLLLTYDALIEKSSFSRQRTTVFKWQSLNDKTS